MARKNRFESEWKSYAKAAFPPDLPDFLRAELRQAFYAGAIAIMSLFARTSDGKALDAINDELNAFGDDMEKNGRESTRESKSGA